MTDTEFMKTLRDYLSRFSEGQKPTVPVFYRADGSIDREKTRALPCFADMNDE